MTRLPADKNNDVIARTYDRTPYPELAFWATHPDHVGMLGRLHGLPTAPPERAAVLEIGCAVGGNLVPMAASAPGARFVGVDLSAVQIARARAAATATGLDNVTFVHGDFRDLPRALGPFDYIVCHGVFAWVSEPTQHALFAFIRDRLAPAGVAFVSYNTYPGHHLVDLVRRISLLAAEPAADPGTRRMRAVMMLRRMQRLAPDDDSLWRTPALEREIQLLQDASPTAITHDYCADESRPVYFEDFVARAAAAGLAYLCDSAPMSLAELRADVGEALERLPDPVARGQLVDLVHGTRYRETLLCHAEAPRQPAPLPAAIPGFAIAHSLTAEPSLVGLAEGLPVEVPGMRRPPLVVSSPLLRLALHRLYHHHRRALSLDALSAEVVDALAAHQLPAIAPERVREALPAQLLRAFHARAVRFALRSPPVARAAPARPVTGRYQRHQAHARGRLLTSLSHEVFEATPMMHALLPHLDGTLDHAALQALWPGQPIDVALAELVRKGFVHDAQGVE